MRKKKLTTTPGQQEQELQIWVAQNIEIGEDKFLKEMIILVSFVRKEEEN